MTKQLSEILEEIDWVRNTLWFFLYIIGVFVLFMGWVVPELDEFRRSNIEYRKSNFLYKEAQKELTARKNELDTFKSENVALLAALGESNNQKLITKAFAGLFEEFAIHDNSLNPNKQGFRVAGYTLEGKSANSALIYRLIQEVGRIGCVAKVNFPILIARDKKDSLHFKVDLEVYTESLPASQKSSESSDAQ
ncbi:MAG: hypothetical protein ACTTH5_04595 [Wolinella sp.]